ncbi:Ig-like domain-containing protein [Hyalangium rubrum]|uniref:Ig-like domain-containing protein n=1 Tax=Hyalangium rubrum TaxID=3103134 RepID=A0ABU5HIF5_9BACT|nr:Ig-like domain-containing protein [Hyalangium sp. s54d21]MDY7233224.1 Ig-like domain-containing protein [Hyalangium sp. s54d21]
MILTPRNRFALLSTLLALGTACRDPSPPPAAQARPPRVSSDTPGGKFDLGEVVRRVHFAYRPDGEGWSAGHSAWTARATATGLTFTPRHALDASRVLTGTPVTFGAASFSRGGAGLELPAGRGGVREDGSLSLTRGEVTEEFHNSESGIEQRWHFARAPQGEGALLIRVPVRGLRFVGETPRGVHFADATGLGVRYSQAAWTDASGKRTELPARFVAGAVEFQVPAALLSGSSFPTLLAPAISPEFGLDTPVTDPGSGTQAAPAIASNGTDYLAVWTDDRGGEVDLYGARVSQAGAVLDGFGIPISTAQNAQLSPAVAFDGTNYFVVWNDGRRGSGTDIYGARVSPNGTVLDPNGTVVATSISFGLMMSTPAVAFDGANYLVAWEEKSGFSAPTNLYGARVSTAGTPVGGTLTLSNATGNQSEVALAFDGTNYVAVWQDERSGTQADIYATRISPNGTVLEPAGISVSAAPEAQRNPTVAFAGTTALVVWEDFRNASTGADLYGARIGLDGSVLDAAGLPLVLQPAAQSRPALTRLGSEYLLGWQDLRSATSQSDVYVARVNAAGTVLDASGVVVSQAPDAQHSVALASNGTSALITWHDARALDIVGARVSAAGAVLDPAGFTASRSANTETSPAVAFDGTNYLVVWQDNRGNGFDIYGVRVSGSGAVLDASGLALSTANGHQRKPALAFDGTNYLVVWEDTRGGPAGDIYGARVSPSGTVLDASGLPLCLRANAQENPAVAFDGTNYLVVWDDAGTSADRNIFGTRVSPAGSVLDVLYFGISTQAGDQVAPALAFDGTNYLVAWSDWRNGVSADVFGARVNRSATVLDATGVQLASGSEAQTDVAVAFDGTNYLVVWTDYRLPPHANLFARRVRTAGTPLDATPITVSAASGHQQLPAVTFNGTDFLVAWQDGRNGTGMDIYGGRVSRTGVALDGDGFVLSESPAAESQVTLASGGTQGVLAVYQATDATLGNPVQRLKARRLSTVDNTLPTADPQSATTDEDQPVVLELTGSDAEGDALTFVIATQPAHGTLTGTSPKFTYTPAANYSGPDSFTFTASDGQGSSAPATVSITVLAVNDAPIAQAQTVSTPEETPKSLTLTATDAEGDAVTFAVASPPSHGTLTGTPPSLTYTPEPNYIGPDSFTFTASDAQGTSAPATVSITVTQVNDAPVPTAQSITTSEGSPVSITLSAVDPEGNSITFALASQPAHGTLIGTPPSLSYRPEADYSGPDSFTFTASDGQATSAPGTISITVTPVNDAPVALGQSFTVEEDTPIPVTLTGSDVDGDSLTFDIVSRPTRGTLSGTPPSLTYTPGANYHGQDSFTFTAFDGQASSAPATISITLTPVNDTPTATARTLTVQEDSQLTVTLAGVDPDGDALTFAVVSQPSHGSLTGTPPSLTYKPEPNYKGPDSFTFTASDGATTSSAATVSITVTNVNDSPVAVAQELTVPAGSPTPIYLNGSDLDGDELTFKVTAPPDEGRISGNLPDAIYTPPEGFTGTTRFTFSAGDGRATSTAIVQLTVVERSLTVSAAADVIRPAEGQQVRFYANAVDKAGAPISLEWTFGDGATRQEDLPVHAFTTAGTYDVQLKATTATEEATTMLRIRVRSAEAIVLAQGPSQPAAVGEESATLAFRVDAPEADHTYTWDFGDGSPTATGATTSYAWKDNGRFTVKVTASNASGVRWTASRALVVHNAPPVPLPQERVTASLDKQVTVKLSGSDAAATNDALEWVLVSGEGSLDEDGTFQWTPSEEGLATIITKVIDGDGGESRLAFQIAAGTGSEEPSEGCGCGSAGSDASGALGMGLLLLALIGVSRRSSLS